MPSDVRKLTLKEAIRELMDFYGIELDGGKAVAMHTILADETPKDVGEAWTTWASISNTDTAK